jgi:hypothetical protein
MLVIYSEKEYLNNYVAFTSRWLPLFLTFENWNNLILIDLPILIHPCSIESDYTAVF